MNTLAAAFIKAKREFAPALKDKTNPAFRSKYADLGACIEAVDDALLSNGIAVYQETFEDSTGVTVETVFLHESGESLRCGKLHVPAAKQDPQGYGSALTYARRYSLMAACGIAPEDDDGNAASKPTNNVRPMKHTGQTIATEHLEALDPQQQEYIREFADGVKYDCANGAVSRAVDLIAAENFEQEQKLALWSLLDSKARAAIKAEEQKRAKAA